MKAPQTVARLPQRQAQRAPAAGAEPSHEEIIDQLVRDLSLGRYRAAVHGFLALKARGGVAPALIERSCEQLLVQARRTDTPVETAGPKP